MRPFKAALLVLLAANTIYFVVAETASKGVDSAAWLILLLLFQAETNFGTRMQSRRTRVFVRVLRLLAGAGVFAATLGYIFEENTLDALNAIVWIVLVILLELELRRPLLVRRHPRLFKASAGVVFAALALLVFAWSAAGMWFDAYDAALWLLAFALLELDITSVTLRGHPAGPAKSA